MVPIAAAGEAGGIPGDSEGFRLLFEAHRAAVHRFLVRLARNAHDADELLQETFVAVWRKRAQFRGDGSVAGYLRQIAYRTYLNARPRIERDRGQLGPDRSESSTSPDAAVEAASRIDQRDMIARVRRVVEELPVGWREAFVLFRFEGLSCAEVAETLGLTPKAVERRLTRALEFVTRRVRAAGTPRPMPAPRGLQ